MWDQIVESQENFGKSTKPEADFVFLGETVVVFQKNSESEWQLSYSERHSIEVMYVCKCCSMNDFHELKD